ncbi:interleukin-33 isoform X2 [Petaurus breviceps papuanus]|uniref:interleukin-33 isoform X2 n=1 Tax=Petaurus breviceps papuanus TaxID=3040969 RepID=UPI0036DF2948
MPKIPEHFRPKMKHLKGKQKNKTKQKTKKTSGKPGFSNSGKDYKITYKNLRSRCIVENEASIIKREMRRYQVKNIQFTPKKKIPNSFPPGFSNSGEDYKIIYKNLRSRCIVENEASIIKREMRRYQVKNMQFTPKKKTPNSFPPGFSNSGRDHKIICKNLRSRCIVENEASIIRPEMTCRMENKASVFRPEMKSYVANLQCTNIKNILSIFPPVYKSTECYTGLNTFKNKAVTFFFENGEYEIFVEDLIMNQERGSLLVDFFSCKNSDEGDSLPLVVLKPRPSNIDLQVHANDQSLELHESENQNSAQENKFFILHNISDFVSFECFRPQGLYIGVKENRLELMEKKEDDEAFMFRLTK